MWICSMPDLFETRAHWRTILSEAAVCAKSGTVCFARD
jgi:hypothetical protein